MKALSVDQAVEKIKTLARQAGIEFDALVVENETFKASYHKGKLDKFDSALSRSMGLRALRDGSEGYASTENFSESALERAFNEAMSSAQWMEAKYPAFINKAEQAPSMSELYHPQLKNVSVEERLEKAKNVEQACYAEDSRVQALTAGGYRDSSSFVRLFNSSGFDENYRKNSCYLMAMPLLSDGNENAEAFEFQYTQNFGELNEFTLAKKVVKEAALRLQARQAKTGKYPIVFQNKAASSLLAQITSFFSAKNVDDGLSPLKNKLKEHLFSKKVTLTDDPFYRGAPGSRPFDGEGTPSTKTVFVNEGQLQTFLTNQKYAKQMKLKNSGNASRGTTTELGISTSNWVLNSGQASFMDLNAMYPRTICVKKIATMAGFNGATGDFSLQVDGDLFENGKLVYPLKSFVLSGNALEVLRDVEEIANDTFIDPSTGVVTPSFLTRELNVAAQND